DALGGSSSKQKKEQKKSKNESDQEETTDAWGFEKPSTSGISQTLKKEQKKSKNESDQEETTDAWGFEKPSTSGIPQTPQKVKTISWKQGVYGIRRGMSNGELENLWVSEKHDTATGKKLFIDMITNVNELSNVLVENISEDTSMYFGGDSINGNAEELRAFYKQEYSHLDKENREEIVQAALLISRLTQRINFAFFARNDWRDQVQERERMQLKGPSVFLVGAAHTLLHEAGGTHSMHNANAYPAYQYPNPDKSIALVPEQLIEYNKHLDRKNKNAAPEYAVWVKSQDESMNDPFLVMGQKSDMEKAFGNKIRLLPK
ncbi:hypothetical protein BSPCLSOX_2086, partial [uncultured Gammaproteobacteria bacterium]